MRGYRLFEGMRRGLGAVLDAILPLLRIVLPALMLYMLTGHAHKVLIPALDIEISVSAMCGVIAALHGVACWFGVRSDGRRGRLYELCCSCLATETVLFVYFMGRQFILSVVLAAVFVGGLFMLLASRKDLERASLRGRLRRGMRRDMILTGEGKRRPPSVLGVAVRRYFAVGAALMMAVPSVMMLTVYGIDGVLQSGNAYAVIDPAQENQIAANRDTIGLLNDRRWVELSDQEKLDVLQVVADIEADYLGIQPVSVVNCRMEEHTIGYYSHAQRQTAIDLAQHEGKSALSYVRTVLHECRHAYQHDCVDSLDWSDPLVQQGAYFMQAREWKRNQDGYVTAEESLSGYYEQAIEQDARDYEENRLYDYRDQIYPGVTWE